MSIQPLHTAFKLMTAGLALSLFLWITQVSLSPRQEPTPEKPKFDPFDPAYQVDVVPIGSLPRVQITGVETDPTPQPAANQADPFAEQVVDNSIPEIPLPVASDETDIPTLTVSDQKPVQTAEGLPEIPTLEVPTAEPEIPALEFPPLEVVENESPLVAPEPVIIEAPPSHIEEELEALRTQQQSLQGTLDQKQLALDEVRRENQSFRELLDSSRSEYASLQKSAKELEALTRELREQQVAAAREIETLKRKLETSEPTSSEPVKLKEPQPVPPAKISSKPDKTAIQLELERLYGTSEPHSAPPAERAELPLPEAPASESASDPATAPPAESIVEFPGLLLPATTCESCCETEEDSLFDHIETFFLKHKHAPSPEPESCEPKGLIPKLRNKFASWDRPCDCTPSCTEAPIIYGMPSGASTLPPLDRPVH